MERDGIFRIAFDIGGVLSKYPDKLRILIQALAASDQVELFVITDMNDADHIHALLKTNGFDFISDANIHMADHARHGELCKAVILKELQIDMLIDDHQGYCQWDSSLGPAPIRCHVQPDPFKPYWDDQWVSKDNVEFCRRRYTLPE